MIWKHRGSPSSTVPMHKRFLFSNGRRYFDQNRVHRLAPYCFKIKVSYGTYRCWLYSSLSYGDSNLKPIVVYIVYAFSDRFHAIWTRLLVDGRSRWWILRVRLAKREWHIMSPHLGESRFYIYQLTSDCELSVKLLRPFHIRLGCSRPCLRAYFR